MGVIASQTISLNIYPHNNKTMILIHFNWTHEKNKVLWQLILQEFKCKWWNRHILNSIFIEQQFLEVIKNIRTRY